MSWTRSEQLWNPGGQDVTGDGNPRRVRPRRLRLVAGVVAIVGVSAATIALTGEGRPAEPECAENFICFWSEPNFGGRKLQQPPDWASTSPCIRLPYSVRSAMNNTRERQRGYANSVDFNAYKHT